MPAFAQARSESILAQLAGELVVEADTNNSFGGDRAQPGNENSEIAPADILREGQQQNLLTK